jgi:hypothetical protein
MGLLSCVSCAPRDRILTTLRMSVLLLSSGSRVSKVSRSYSPVVGMEWLQCAEPSANVCHSDHSDINRSSSLHVWSLREARLETDRTTVTGGWGGGASARKCVSVERQVSDASSGSSSCKLGFKRWVSRVQLLPSQSPNFTAPNGRTLGYWWMGNYLERSSLCNAVVQVGGSGFDSRQRQDFIFSMSSRQILRPTQPRTQSATKGFSPGE